LIELILNFWHVISHLDAYLVEWSHTMGGSLYLLLFAVIFCETGLVVTPFLPGDSLLFAIGALCAIRDDNGVPGMQIAIAVPLFMLAAVLGDAANYSIGRALGPKVFSSEKSKLLNRNHLLYTQGFYEKYGGKTIIIARFVPIVRTFAPFVAGVGRMRYSRFFAFNVIGAIGWVCTMIPAGYWLGNQDFVRKRFHIVIFAIIGISLLPAIIEIVRERRRTATS
jgi:membrane-associated protein